MVSMRVRILTLRYDPLLDGFDDGPLRELQKDRRLIAVHDHFFESDCGPRLALVVRYEPKAAVEGVAGATVRGGNTRAEKWRELLTPDDLPLFNTLREWRRERARRDGVPPYVICTNRQLALLVRARPQSLAKIGEINGFGKGKLERYGGDILAIVREHSPGDREPPEQGSEASDG